MKFSITNDPHFFILKINNRNFYIKKPLKFLRKTQTQYSYRTILSSWLFNGISKPLMDHLAFLESSNEAWAYENKSIWLIYATCLLYMKEKEEALRILYKYNHYFGKKDFAYFLPLANLAFENNFITKEIETANSLFLRFEENQKHNYFEEKIKNAKNIAIVGTAPNQLNKGTGKEIDNHDVVIRVNPPITIDKYKDDYGYKTDILAGSITNFWHTNSYEPNKNLLVMRCHNYWNRYFLIHKFNPNSVNCNSLSFAPLELTQKFDKYILPRIPIPSTGYITALWVYHILGNFNNVKFYGYSFLDEKNIYNRFYNTSPIYPLNFTDERRFIMHDFTQERINLKKLYFNK